MKIAMIGTGYVGLVSGTCFSEFGTEVVCVDKDATKIEGLKVGRMPIYEPGLAELVASNVEAGRLSFTTDLAAALEGAAAVFIGVGTPTRPDSPAADLTHVYAAVEEAAAHLEPGALVVTKSTVPVGTGREIRAILDRVRPDNDFHVVSNPEFLREGSAIEDFLRPDRVMVGIAEGDGHARDIMAALYRPLYLIETPILFTSVETAELTKYAGNAFLATKITFINEIADLCEKVGADVQQVAKGIGLDGRIGPKFLHAGPGYGGSCFPKDTRALAWTAKEAGSPLQIVESVIRANEERKFSMAERVIAHCGGSVAGKIVAVLGLTFKPNTDDMRDAPSLTIVPALQAAGATVCAFDPEGMEEAAKLLPDVDFCNDAYEAAAGAHCLVIITEWNQFRNLDLARLKRLMVAPRMVDLRNVYAPMLAAKAGFDYRGIGRAMPVGNGPETQI